MLCCCKQIRARVLKQPIYIYIFMIDRNKSFCAYFYDKQHTTLFKNVMDAQGALFNKLIAWKIPFTEQLFKKLLTFMQKIQKLFG